MGTKRKNIAESMAESKKEFHEKYSIPDEIRKFINEKAEHTNRISKGGIDKTLFILAMITMYYHLKQNPELLKP